jgi:hypothetical protein
MEHRVHTKSFILCPWRYASWILTPASWILLQPCLLILLNITKSAMIFSMPYAYALNLPAASLIFSPLLGLTPLINRLAFFFESLQPL